MRLIAAAICYVIHWNYDCMQLAWKVLYCFFCKNQQSLSHFLSLSHYWVTDNISNDLVHIFSPEKNTDKNNDFRRPLIPMICEFLSESETVFAQLAKKSDHRSNHWNQTLQFFNCTYFSCQIKDNNYYSIFQPLSALIVDLSCFCRKKLTQSMIWP